MFTESPKQIELIERKIDELKRLDTDSIIFPSSELGQENSTLSADDLHNFEKLYEVKLPACYKIYMNKIGEGRFGILPLNKKLGEDFPAENCFENLKKPFPYTEKWNADSLEEFSKKYKFSNKIISGFVDLLDYRKRHLKHSNFKEKEQLKLFDYDGFYESEEFVKYLFTEYYYSDSHLNGSVYLMDHGCNIRGLLIVTGKQRGKIWIDDRANGIGIYPTGMTFFRWFYDFLDESIQTLKK